MKLSICLSIVLLLLPPARGADNLRAFTLPMSLPICGANDNDASGIPPFATCTTLTGGFSISLDYADEGLNVLSKLIVAILDTGQDGSRFESLAGDPLPCRLAPVPGTYIEPVPPAPGESGTPSIPDGVPPPIPAPLTTMSRPACTKNDIKSYLIAYNNRPEVQAYRKFETKVKELNLADPKNITKLRKATVIVRATGGSITFADLTTLLE